MSESKSKLERKQEELESLELDAEILNVEEKIKRRQKGEPATETQAPKDTLGDTLVKEVVIPIVKKRLEPDDKSSSVTQEALKVANKALDARRGAPRSPGDTVSEVINVITQVKDLIKDDSLKIQIDEVTKQLKEIQERKPEAGKALGKEFVEFLDLYDKIQERVKPTGGGSSDGYYDFERWKVDQNRKTTMQDRAFNLRIRQQDKEHDLAIAALGIEKERNNLIKDALKKFGTAVGEALGEDDEFEEEETKPAKGRGQLIKEKCSECGAEVLIPPEAQVAGKEITCSKCDSIFTWE